MPRARRFGLSSSNADSGSSPDRVRDSQHRGRSRETADGSVDSSCLGFQAEEHAGQLVADTRSKGE